MKALIFLLFFLIKLSCFSQNSFYGTYSNSYNEITFYEDSTFYHEYRFDLFYNVSRGTWSADSKGEIIYLKVTFPVFDTLFLNGKDTLVISNNEIPQRINYETYIASTSKVGRHYYFEFPPSKLRFKKGRLFAYNNNEKLIKKQKDIFTGSYFSGEYKKIQELLPNK